MSSPHAADVRSVIDRVLGAYAEHSGVELALKLGVVDSYVTKLRSGWRPTRVRADLWARLVSLDPDAAKARPAGSVDYYDGVLFAAQAMSETVTRLLAEARAGLRTEAAPAKRPSPTAGEIAVGLQAMRAVEAAEANARRGKSG